MASSSSPVFASEAVVPGGHPGTWSRLSKARLYEEWLRLARADERLLALALGATPGGGGDGGGGDEAPSTDPTGQEHAAPLASCGAAVPPPPSSRPSLSASNTSAQATRCRGVGAAALTRAPRPSAGRSKAAARAQQYAPTYEYHS